jgi:hypothetical protein
MPKVKEPTVTMTVAEYEALKAQAERKGRGKASDTWRTLSDRQAGKGFPCTVAGKGRCSRTDLRLKASGASHDATDKYWHVAR